MLRTWTYFSRNPLTCRTQKSGSARLSQQIPALLRAAVGPLPHLHSLLTGHYLLDDIDESGRNQRLRIVVTRRDFLVYLSCFTPLFCWSVMLATNLTPVCPSTPFVKNPRYMLDNAAALVQRQLRQDPAI
jgi:hypothetical protein